MESLVTQVPQAGPAADTLHNHYHDGQFQVKDNSGNGEFVEDDYGSSLIHLNIRESHYYITRDQLMSLPESLLLCLFPSGVFLDRNGQVITNLTAEDEVYIPNFFPDCFEYIMKTYTEAYENYLYFPVNKIFDRSQPSKGLFSFGSTNHESAEQEILHEKPTIIVLKEDLDYYCVPQSEFVFDNKETSEDLLYHIMAQVKSAAGSYLTSKKSIFQGLYSSNRLKRNNNGGYNQSNLATPPSSSSTSNSYHNHNIRFNQHNDSVNGNSATNPMDSNGAYQEDYYAQKDSELGPAEQHLKDMLCSSGFHNESVWGNRFQEPGKTVISSLSLCRIANETTESFRQQYTEAKTRWEREQQQNQHPPKEYSLSPTESLTPSESNNGLKPSTSNQTIRDRPPSRTGRDKRKSRLSALADNVRSRSGSRQRSQSRQRETPKLYELVPKPDINVKLLLFWRKPARKCWWGEEDLELEVEIYGSWDLETSNSSNRKPTIRVRTPENPEDGLNKVRIPLRLHIRRVWTLELSVVGVQ